MDKRQAELDLCRAKARNDREAERHALDALLDINYEEIRISTSTIEIEWLGYMRDDLAARLKKVQPGWWERRKAAVRAAGGKR